MRVITSKYPSKCRECGGPVGAGERIFWARGEGVMHLDCDPFDTSAMHQDVADMNRQNAEYAMGVADADTYLFNRDTFGEDFAASEELAHMYRTGEGL